MFAVTRHGSVRLIRGMVVQILLGLTGPECGYQARRVTCISAVSKHLLKCLKYSRIYIISVFDFSSLNIKVIRHRILFVYKYQVPFILFFGYLSKTFLFFCLFFSLLLCRLFGSCLFGAFRLLAVDPFS